MRRAMSSGEVVVLIHNDDRRVVRAYYSGKAGQLRHRLGRPSQLNGPAVTS